MSERPAHPHRPPRILLAKPGLDGHDRGVHVVARTLRDAGFEVIYTGLRATAQQIVRNAIDEDVDVVGLSILSGVHLAHTADVAEGLRQEGVSIPVVVGGTIGQRDERILRDLGVADVFPVRSRRDDIVDRIRRLVEAHRGSSAAGETVGLGEASSSRVRRSGSGVRP